MTSTTKPAPASAPNTCTCTPLRSCSLKVIFASPRVAGTPSTRTPSIALSENEPISAVFMTRPVPRAFSTALESRSRGDLDERPELAAQAPEPLVRPEAASFHQTLQSRQKAGGLIAPQKVHRR